MNFSFLPGEVKFYDYFEQASANLLDGAVILFTSSALGVPVSTTHTITGAIVGVGSIRRRRAVRWGVAADHPHRRRHLGADLPDLFAVPVGITTGRFEILD